VVVVAGARDVVAKVVVVKTGALVEVEEREGSMIEVVVGFEKFCSPFSSELEHPDAKSKKSVRRKNFFTERTYSMVYD
jgi:hypothetical protein